MAHPVDIYVGSRLRQQRKLLGLTQKQFGEKVGLTYQQIQKYEAGNNGMRASRIYEFANILNVSILYFFRGYEDERLPESL